MELADGTVRIRPGRPEDEGTLLDVLSDEEVTRWWPASSHNEMMDTLLGREKDALGFVVVVGDRIAGYIQYYEEADPQYRHAGIDVVIGGGFRDRGVGTKAVRLMARYLFEERGHHRIVIDPNAGNPRAIRTYEKVGFKPVGVMRQYEWDAHRGEWTDAILMDLLREDLTDA